MELGNGGRLELYIDLVENNLYNVKMLKTEVGNGT
jgi:hypothetical protein